MVYLGFHEAQIAQGYLWVVCFAFVVIHGIHF